MSQKQKDAMIKYIQEVGQLVKGKNKLHWQVGFFPPPQFVLTAKASKEKVTADRRNYNLGSMY